MPSYQFKEVVPLRGGGKLDPQRTGEIIEKLRQESEDLPTALWQAAQSPRHYLHRCYPWDVQAAAEAHWRDISRRIISCLVVASEREEDEPPRAFINVRADDGRRYYVPTEIHNSFNLQVATLKSAMRDLEAFRLRYRTLADICPEIERAQQTIAERLRKAEGDRPQAA